MRDFRALKRKEKKRKDLGCRKKKRDLKSVELRGDADAMISAVWGVERWAFAPCRRDAAPVPTRGRGTTELNIFRCSKYSVHISNSLFEPGFSWAVVALQKPLERWTGCLCPSRSSRRGCAPRSSRRWPRRGATGGSAGRSCRFLTLLVCEE